MKKHVEFEYSAGGVLLDDTGRVLLIRTRNLRGEPVWTFPKGHIERGEKREEAALREVREETGYEAEIVEPLPPVTYWFWRNGTKVRKTVYWFLMRPRHQVGEPDEEVEEIRWVHPTEALLMLTYSSDRDLLKQILRKKGGEE